MIKDIVHVGVTVSDMDEAINFYRDILGLRYMGEIEMKGEQSSILFGREGASARVAYLNGDQKLSAPPIELIQFTDENSRKDKADLFKTSISEICFRVDDIYKVYDELRAKGVEFLSEPQKFDFTSAGFEKSIAVYFKGPDSVILELIQTVD